MNTEILSTVFTRFRQRLRSTALSLTSCEDDADDIIQEAFARLWTKRMQYSSEQHAMGAAITTVRNLSIDTIRARNKENSSLPEACIDNDEQYDDTDETINRVMRIISSTLNPRHQHVLIMRDRWGWEIADIANELNLTEANVRLILSRARKTVRETYLQLKTDDNE